MYRVVANQTKGSIKWTEECQTSFDILKNTLTIAPVLVYPNPSEPYILDSDSSSVAIGSALYQIADGKERVIAYFSKALSKPERNYCITRKEVLAVVRSVKHSHHHLYGSKFVVRTDNGALTWHFKFKNREDQLAY